MKRTSKTTKNPKSSKKSTKSTKSRSSKKTKPTIYTVAISADEAIKGAFFSDPKELTKFTNSVMNKNHDPETAVVMQLKTEHITPIITSKSGKSRMTYDKVIADMLFSIDGIIYGIEFQTGHDNTILCRITEYQLNAMIDMVKSMGFANEYEGELTLPRMMVVQLERSENVPNEYKLWYKNDGTGERILQKFPIVKLWEHTIDELSKNGMHLLLPFKIIDIRKSIKGKEMDEATTAKFLEMNEQIYNKIMELFNHSDLSYTAMEKMNHAHGSLIQYFNEKFISSTNPLKGDVERMFAEVMDRRNVVTKEDILREGMLAGEREGLRKGIREGNLEGETREKREMLIAVALSGASFKVFKSVAEARGVSHKQYMPIYGDALNVRIKRGDTISMNDDTIPFQEAERKLVHSRKQ